jgi:hypothetical protein
MAEIQRQDIISDDALQAPLVLSQNLQTLLKTVDQVVQSTRQIGQNTSAATTAGKLKEQTTSLTAEQQNLLKIQSQIAQLVAKDNDAYREQEKALQKLKKEVKERSVLGDKDAKAANKLNSSITELGAALNKNRQAYAQLRTEEQRNTKEGKELLKIIQQQDTEYKELKATMGQHQDQVGNYEGAMKSLKLELRAAKDQLAGIAEQLGEDSEEYKNAALKAGELQDKIGDLNEASKAVSGEPIERLGGSFDLIVDKVRALDFKGAQSGIKQFTAASKDLTFKQATQGIGGFTKGVVNMGKAILGNPLFLLVALIVGLVVLIVKLKDSIKPLKIAFDLVGAALDYVLQLGKDFLDWLGLSTFALDEHAAAVVENSKKEVEAIRERYDDEIAIAEAAGKEVFELERKKYEDIIREATKGLVELHKKRERNNNELEEEDQAHWDELIKIVKDANIALQVLALKEAAYRDKLRKDEEKKRKEAILREQGDWFKLQMFRIQLAIDAQNEIADDEKRTWEERTNAAIQAESLMRKLAAVQHRAALSQENLTNSGRILINEEFQAKLVEITKAGSEKRIAITQSEFEEDKANHEKRLAIARDKAAQLIVLEQNRVDKVVQAIQKAALDGNLSVEEADREIKKVRQQNLDEMVQAQIDGLNAILFTEDLTAEERAGIEQELFKLKVALTDAYYQQLEDKEKSALERTVETLQTTQDLYTMFADSISNLMGSLFEQRMQQFDMEQMRLEEGYENEIKLAGDNEAAKAAIDERYAAAQEDLEKRRIKEQQRIAKFEKATALIGAAINTALSITKTLSTMGVPAGIPFAVAAGVAGAIQIAAIAAKPIPQFEKGGKHKGGLFIGGEAGEELVKFPDGSMAITPPRATLMSAPAGTEILNHDKTLRELAKAQMRRTDYMVPQEDRASLSMIGQKLDVLTNTVKNKREVHHNISKKGAETLFRKAQTTTYYLNEVYK